jgi:hypothetical protein
MRAANLSCILTLSAPVELCDTTAMAAAVFPSSETALVTTFTR